MIRMRSECDTTLTPQQTEHVTSIDDPIWGHFKNKVASIRAPTSDTSSTLEMRKYCESPLAPLDSDPLLWWKTRELIFPNLSKIAKKKLSVVATSVPSERAFSKAGQLVSDRRSRLKAKNVKEILFLNSNLDRFKD